METPPLIPGYRVGDLIAHGSSATVWSASPIGGDRDLAAKVVPLCEGDDGEALALELSALATTREAEDHLVSVLDVVAVTDPVPAVAIVMERLRHGTLTRLVSTRGHLTPGEVVTVLTPVALTVARLHDGALIHGDLSPSNVGFDTRGRPVILDLGVSSVMGSPREEIYGTPGFVAPEVVAGQPPTPSADVYAIGALGWYALTGELPPIPADRPSLDTLVADVPEEMRLALERALHPEPERRGDGRELAAAVYGSTPAAPITPGEGTDAATMLTHRVRELARSADRDRDPATAQGRQARHAALRVRSRGAHLRVVTTLVATVLVGVAGVAAASVGRGAAPVPVAPATARPEPPRAAADDTRQVNYAELLGTLVEARAAAWTAGAPASLTASFAEGSAALEGDVARLTQAEQDGHRYEGLRFTVTDLRLLTESEDRVRIEATIETSRYAVHTEAVEATSVVERDGSRDRVTLTLVRAEAGWRIGEMQPVLT